MYPPYVLCNIVCLVFAAETQVLQLLLTWMQSDHKWEVTPNEEFKYKEK